jgi:hypothetical protein
VVDGSAYSVGGSLQLLFTDNGFVGAVTGSAALDGLFSIAAGDGVSLQYADPEFLAAPIPLPAGWGLLAGAIAMGLALRRARPDPGRAGSGSQRWIAAR